MSLQVKRLVLAAAVVIWSLAGGQAAFAWGPPSSGPNFTGTAEVEPAGSWYFEPWFYEYLQPGENSRSLAMPQRFALGIGYMSELDVYPNFLFNTAGPPPGPAGASSTRGSIGKGTVTSRLGVGNFHFELKHQLVVDQDTEHLLALPAVSL